MKWLPGPHQTIISNYQKLSNFLKEKVEQHRPDWDSDNPRDYIDTYLTETEKVKTWQDKIKSSAAKMMYPLCS